MQLLAALYERTKDILRKLAVKDFGSPCGQVEEAQLEASWIKAQLKPALRAIDLRRVEKISAILEDLKQRCCGQDASDCEAVLEKIEKEKRQATRARSANRRERA